MVLGAPSGLHFMAGLKIIWPGLAPKSMGLKLNWNCIPLHFMDSALVQFTGVIVSGRNIWPPGLSSSLPQQVIAPSVVDFWAKRAEKHIPGIFEPFILTGCSVNSRQPRKGSRDNKPPTLLLALLLSTSTMEDGLAKGGTCHLCRRRQVASGPEAGGLNGIETRFFGEPFALTFYSLLSGEGLKCSLSPGNT